MGVAKRALSLYSWNVNGIRAASKNGFLDWFKAVDADVVCLQEVKAFREQIPQELQAPEGYQVHWNAAQKPGYSGTATYTRIEPTQVHSGIGFPEFDSEGRVLITEFKDWAVFNCYFPNSQREGVRLPYKLDFCREFLKVLKGYESRGIAPVICGDLNIAHQAIDLKNPKANEKNAGYLPEERAWMTELLNSGYIDTYRHFFPDQKDAYSWWSYRPGIRERNIGWRLDYFVTAHTLRDRLQAAEIHAQVRGSDHCPVSLKIDLP